MGLVNAALEGKDGAVVGVTYMTGTLVQMGQKIANRLRGQGDGRWFHHFGLWAALVGGAILLWQQGQASAGDIAASGAIAMRLAQMTLWSSPGRVMKITRRFPACGIPLVTCRKSGPPLHRGGRHEVFRQGGIRYGRSPGHGLGHRAALREGRLAARVPGAVALRGAGPRGTSGRGRSSPELASRNDLWLGCDTGRRSSRLSGERDKKMDAMANAPSRGASLVDQLRQQWSEAEPLRRVASSGRSALTP